jgi:hypothetical protein
MKRLDPKPAIPAKSTAAIPELARNPEPLRSDAHPLGAADQSWPADRRQGHLDVACAIVGGEAPACR